MLSLGFVLLFAASVAGETVYLESLNNDAYRRSQELGQPETLNFRLRHSSGEVELNLEENVRLNANAPIFINRRKENGDSVAVHINVPENEEMKFFQDKRNGAYARTTCLPGPHGPCFNTLEGNVVINGKEYKLQPVTDGADKRHASLGVPHTLEELKHAHTTGHTTMGGKGIAIATHDDYVIRDDELPNEDPSEIEGLTEEEVDRFERLLARLEHKATIVRNKRQAIVAHGIELVLAIDHLVYNLFAEIHNTLGVEGILAKMREYYSHVINGVDLRYASIQEDDISFYVTVAGFSISTQESDSPWLTYGGDTTDGLAGLQFMRTWRDETEGLPVHDHAAFITGSDIAYSGSSGVVGIAYLDGVCTFWGVSINEEFGYFQGAGVLAHELGHNLGAPHDSGETGGPCDPNADFIMQPFVPSLSATSTTINPWRFSSCSIESFRTYVNSLGTDDCTLDQATIYNVTEFNLHNSSLAGQLYSNNEQCELLRGDGATFCSGNADTADVCRRFGCASSGSTSCFRYVAAHGTACGNGLVCFEGLCQLEDSTQPPPTAAPPTAAPTTAAPTTAAPTTAAPTTAAPTTAAPTTAAPTTAAPTTAAPTTAAPTTAAPTTAAPTTPAPTTPAPTTPAPTTPAATSPRVTETTTDFETTTSQGLTCVNNGRNGFYCNQLRMFFGNKNRMCKRFAADCCGMCLTICRKDRTVRGRETYTCSDLIDVFGLENTCDMFAYECCYTCHIAKR